MTHPNSINKSQNNSRDDAIVPKQANNLTLPSQLINISSFSHKHLSLNASIRRNENIGTWRQNFCMHQSGKRLVSWHFRRVGGIFIWVKVSKYPLIFAHRARPPTRNLLVPHHGSTCRTNCKNICSASRDTSRRNIFRMNKFSWVIARLQPQPMSSMICLFSHTIPSKSLSGWLERQFTQVWKLKFWWSAKIDSLAIGCDGWTKADKEHLSKPLKIK